MPPEGFDDGPPREGAASRWDAADVWAVGILLFQMGVDSNLERLREQVCQAAFVLPRAARDAELLDLLRALLEPAPQERVTAAAALTHPWLARHTRRFDADKP